MILYLDTSALVKRYIKEPYSDDVITKWKSATQIVTSFVAYAELMASLYRKKREDNITELLIREIVNSFHRDWESFIRVEVNDQLNDYINRLVEKYPLRGFDAIHLAAATVIYERFSENFEFVCFDDKLVKAAGAEGFKTFPYLT